MVTLPGTLILQEDIVLITNVCDDTLMCNDHITGHCDHIINHKEGIIGYHYGSIGQCNHMLRYSRCSVGHEDEIIEYYVGTIWHCDVKTSNAMP